MPARLKDGGYAVLGFLAVLFFTALPLLLVWGGLQAADRFLPLLFALSWLALAVVLFVLVPLSFFRRTRSGALVGMLLSSYLFGLSLWLWGLYLTFVAWGWVGIVIGLLFMGIGVVPLGMLAALVHSDWSILIQMLALAGLVLATRLGPALLDNSTETPVPETGGA